MRNVILILACLCVTTTGFFLVACQTSPKAQTQEIVYLMDVTEADFVHPGMKDLEHISLISKTSNSLAGEKTRIVKLSEVSLNQIFEVSILALPSAWLSNEIERKADVDRYHREISRVILETDSLRMQRESSAIFAPLARELNRLQASTAERKIVILSSDLMEKSILADFYSSKVRTELQNEPEKWRTRFLEKYPIHSLEGIEVYLIYAPNTPEEANRFEVVSTFYKTLLQGAKITVSANL